LRRGHRSSRKLDAVSSGDKTLDLVAIGVVVYTFSFGGETGFLAFDINRSDGDEVRQVKASRNVLGKISVVVLITRATDKEYSWSIFDGFVKGLFLYFKDLLGKGFAFFSGLSDSVGC